MKINYIYKKYYDCLQDVQNKSRKDNDIYEIMLKEHMLG